MSLNKIKKEDLELMSYTDIAEIILKEQNQTSTPELFRKIVELLELPNSTFEAKIGDFYTSMSTDKRFVLIDGTWDLKTRHVVKPVILEEEDDDFELEDIEEKEEDIEEDSEDNYGDEDTDTGEDEFKNLVIIDEEDLELEQ